VTSNRFTHTLVSIAFLLAFTVVILGAFTRLTDAGLGCPDWPGCYGHLLVPETSQAIHQADIVYPVDPVQPTKAWHEMIHRYAAGTLALLVFIFALLAIRNRKDPHQPVAIPLLLVALIMFQAALGMWTVTLQLFPVVVMGHLLGGMSVLALLWLMKLQLGRNLQLRDLLVVKKFRPWAALGLCVLAFQIMLGGWTSANYAALACPDFPFCHGQMFPIHEFRHAFNLFMPIGADFQGGVLDSAERVTIHMMHRFGAVVTALYLFWLSSWVMLSSVSKTLRIIVAIIVILLITQICLGILNVVLMLPLAVAVMHNAFAALLLLAVVSLNYALYAKPVD
jgi:cytochrome c oxidase assembly protein subunit 15